jgi:hypothetical protein
MKIGFFTVSVPVHIAMSMQQFLAVCSLNVIPHPPDLPDLAPCDILFLENEIAVARSSFQGCPGNL